MCNLQVLTVEGLPGNADTDGETPNGAMRTWPIVAVSAAAPNLQQPPGCNGRCDQSQECLAKQERMNK